MKKYIHKMLSVIITVLLISGSNFGYALSHLNCILVDGGYITCEMDCCRDNPCLDDDKDKLIIKDDSNGCCRMYIEQSTEQDLVMPVAAKVTDNSKIIFSFVSLNYTAVELPGSFPYIPNFKPPDKHTTFSILRI